ncbi:oligoendopeptidase F [Liquorilactobacillus mali]|uniref:oligoendopeptidase F n=1 Tax=Liquorilactobacillus mali TaxID=1618 RepID=UPI00295512FE|nr:oligoendopeptidase F [Liquorilactobacillus mali]MDV7756750.1 oligoendopeptidase F [Liquorilactobacillus mali]
MSKEISKLKSRSEVPEELKWDLTKVYQNENELAEDIKGIQEKIKRADKLKNTLKDGSLALKKALKTYFTVERKTVKLYVYTSMLIDQDTNNKKNQGLFSQAQQLYAKVAAAFSWFEPELLALGEKKLNEYYDNDQELTGYKQYISKIMAKKDHLLSEKEEKLLAGASDIFSTPENIFGILNNADLKFPTVTDEKGNKVELSHGLYGKFLESGNRRVRKEAFQGLYKTYGQFENTFATSLAAHVHTHNFQASVRNYPDAVSAALSTNNIPVAVYDTLVERVNNHLDLLHRYVEVRKEVLNLDSVHMYDLYAPITKLPEEKYNYKNSKKIALDALSIFGEDYVQTVKNAFASRWIDVLENTGKRSGAYSSGMFDTPPYILLNWQDNLESLFTLVHEMGHSMHSYLSNHNQPYHYSDYSIFVAEIASTTNENILTQYLLDNSDDLQFKAYVLNHYLDGFKGTVYRQTQFAEFERWLHDQDKAGLPLTSQELNNKYANLNEHYYGPAITNDPEIALEWSRIPHFYYNFYVYQYATGFAAASALAGKIVKEGPASYLEFLKSGSSALPIDIVKQAGVDMTKPNYLDDAFVVFEQRLGELEDVLAKLQN